jgi:hypothetical protein
MESDGRTSVQCIAFHGLGSIAEALHKMSDLTSSSPEGRGFRLSGRNRWHGGFLLHRGVQNCSWWFVLSTGLSGTPCP